MKLATATGDFARYTTNQAEAVRYIREAGFLYLDYNFHLDYARGNGFFGGNPTAHLANMKKAAEEAGVRFVQAHAPMGDPIKEGNTAFSEATARCIEAAAALGIENIVVHTGYEKGLSREETFAQKLFGQFIKDEVPAKKTTCTQIVANTKVRLGANVFFDYFASTHGLMGHIR